MRRRTTCAVVVSTALLTTALSGCGDGEDTTACGPVERVVVPGSNLHVFDGDDVTYEISPPTSGPHQLPAPPGGIHETPVPEARQVSALEAGMVIIQYSDAVDPEGVAGLRELAGDRVLVTPAARELDEGATVAFTAWVHRRLCTEVDTAAARSFVAEYTPDSPTADHD